jgi:hypothetical protein
MFRVCNCTDMLWYVKAADRWRTKVVSSRAVVRLKITIDRKRKWQHQQSPVAAAACNMHKCSDAQMFLSCCRVGEAGEKIACLDPRIPQASSTRHIDPRDPPSGTISPLFGNGTDGVVSLISVSLTIATNIAVPVDLNSIGCVAVLTPSAMHGQSIQSTALPSHV